MTILVGENGCGKSTLLEGLATKVGSVTVGGTDIMRDDTLRHARTLSHAMKLSWSKRTHRGFFLRAEDFFNFARRLKRQVQEYQELADQYDRELSGHGRKLAMGTALGQKQAITSRYGENLDNNSHGESFLKLFNERFVPGGLYILDEPEAPLSPARQLSFLAMIADMTQNRDAQFIIATHAPIIMACPNAQIINMDTVPPELAKWEDLEHVQITRDFLADPELYLRHLV